MDHRPIRLRPGHWVIAIAFSSMSCATLTERETVLVPTKHELRTGPFVLFSNFPMSADSEAVRCLEALKRDLSQDLDFQPTPADDPVEIYVLDDRSAFTHFLRFYYPELPPRRAFFLAQGERRVVYTYASPRLEEDLRHEATHALLHGWYGNLPLWLDEGLAEYFENDLAQADLERARLDLIAGDLASGWSPNRARLESLSKIHEMSPRDYREAWAWVHLHLKGSPAEKSRLLAALAGLKQTSGTLSLSAQGVTTEQLLAHLKSSPPRDKAVAAAEPAVRLQDRGAEAPALVTTAAPRGVWRRLRAWIGL